VGRVVGVVAGMNLEPIAVAGLVAVGPTLAALGAWRSSGKANRAVNNRPAEAPTISDDVAVIRTNVAKLSEDLDTHLVESARATGRLDEHLRDHAPPSRRRRS